MTIRDSLAQVQELLGRATFGVLRADAHKDWFQPTVMLHSGENIIARYHHGYPDFTCTVGKSEYEWRNADAIEACVNFFMQHGPELMKMLDRHGAGDAEDAARYRWLRTVTPYRFKKLQDACIADATDTTYFLGDKFDAAIDAARAGERGVS